MSMCCWLHPFAGLCCLWKVWGEWSDMAAEQQLAIRTAVSKGRCDMLLLVAGGFEPFLANHMLRIVGTCWNMLEHVGTCWNMLEHVGTCWNMLERHSCSYSHYFAIRKRNAFRRNGASFPCPWLPLRDWPQGAHAGFKLETASISKLEL